MKITCVACEEKTAEVAKLKVAVDCLRTRIKSVKEQRDMLIDCLAGICENYNNMDSLDYAIIRTKIAELRQSLGQSEIF